MLLVLLVVAVSLAMIFSAYHAAVNSVQDEAVSGLQTAATARRDAIAAYVAHEQFQLTAALKAINLGCGPTGVMDMVCAREDVRRLVKQEHALAARLSSNKAALVTAGKFANYPANDTGGAVSVRGGSTEAPTFVMRASDSESAMALSAEFPGEALPHDDTHGAELFLVTPQAIYETGAARADIAIPESLLRTCDTGQYPTLDQGNYIVARRVPTLQGACVVSWASQAQVLAPVKRLRKQLARTGLLFVLAALAIGYVLGFALTRPLTLLTRRARQVRKGDYSSPVPVAGSGEVRQLAVAFGDMTSSVHETLSALATAERRLSLACRAARLSLWQYELSTKAIVWIDPAARTPKPRTLSLRQFLRRVHPDDRPTAIAAVRTAGETGEYEAEYRLRLYGRYVWVATWGQMMPGEGGKSSTMGGVCLDATARRESDHLRVQKEKLLAAADMASELAHQINNPLSAVTGAIYMATRHAGADPQLAKFLAIADTEGKRLANIARQLVTLYAPAAEPENVDIRELVDSAIVSCGRQFRERRDSLEAQLEWTGRILGFRDELRQAVLNLLTNAVEHSPDASRIVVRTRRGRMWERSGSRGVRITVANDGPGFPERRIGEMLEPFSGTKDQRGTGLGLWVTRSVVLKHGGKLRVRSTPKKTVCVVYLPAKAS